MTKIFICAILISTKEKGGLIIMLELILAALFWNVFKGSKETPEKKRRYHLATNFARK